MSQLPLWFAASDSKDANRERTARFLLAPICFVLATTAVAASDPMPLDADVQSTEQGERSALLVTDSKAGKKSPPSVDGSADESEEDCE